MRKWLTLTFKVTGSNVTLREKILRPRTFTGTELTKGQN